MPWLKFPSIAIFVLGCNFVSTQRFLDGEHITDGRSAIKLTVPANGSTISNESNMFFAWQEVPGVSKYVIELSENIGFTKIALRKTVSGPEYLLSRSDFNPGYSLDAIGYYWRVGLPAAKNSLTSNSFIVNYVGATATSTADATFYVDNAFTGTSYGTKNQPFKTIQAGLDAAAGARAASASAKAEVRVSKGTYYESIGLRGNVALKGGFNSAQNWARNPAAHLTIISVSNGIAVSGGADLLATYTNTLMEGFKINVTQSSTTLSGVSFVNAAATIRNNYFIYHISSTLTSSATYSAFFFQLSSLTMDSNIFSTTVNSNVANISFCGITTSGGSVTLNNNIIYIGWVGTNVLSYVNAVNAGMIGTSLVMTITSNTLMASGTGFAAIAATPIVIGATTFSGGFERNLLYGLGSAAANYFCGQQLNGATKFTTFKNNAFVDCFHGGTNGYWLSTGNIQPSSYTTWTTVANAASSGVSLDNATGPTYFSNVGNNPVSGCSGTCAALSGNRAGFTVPTTFFPNAPSVIFQGYVAGDPTTFSFRPNTIADMDSNGSYDAMVDAGANTVTAGLVELPQ